MKSMKLSEYLRIVRPEYIFIKIKPNNSIRNNGTHKIAKAISSLYRNAWECVNKEEEKLIKVLGKKFVVPTKAAFQFNSKVSYYIYIEKKKVEFYLILPKHHESIIRERISDSWNGLTIETVEQLPSFKETSTKLQLVYRKEDALSLATDRRDNDLLNSNLNIIDVMQEGDKAGIFYNFIPTSQFSWSGVYRNTMTKLHNRMPVDRDKAGLSYVLKYAISFISGLANDMVESFHKPDPKKEQQNFLQLAMEKLNGGPKISTATEKKASATILETQIILMSESKNELRQRNNARSLAQSFDAISGDNALKTKPYKKTFQFTDYRIKGAESNKTGDEECQHFLSLAGRELLEKYDCIEKVLTNETQVPEDLRKGVMRIGTNTFRGNKQKAYLSTDQEFKNLALVLIGPNRSGKSTLIQNLTFDAMKAGECTIIFDFIDKCQLSGEVAALFPPEKILNIECDDLNKIQGLGYNEIGYSDDPEQQYINAKRQTTQLATLINSVNTSDAPLTPKMSRYLECASVVVFLSGGAVRDVFDTLQDHRTRAQWIKKVPGNLKERMSKFIYSLEELDEVDRKTGDPVGTHHSYIVGVIDRLNKLEANPYMERMLEKGTEGNINLTDEIQKNQLICIKMPGKMFSTDGERDPYCLYWLTKIWLALQMRTDQFNDRHKMKKVNLIVDELYQVKGTEAFLTNILSRLPKYQFKPIISCHYLNQIGTLRPELRAATASYMMISGCDLANYREMKSELYPYTEEDLLNLPRYHSLNLIKYGGGYGRFITKLPKPVSKLKPVKFKGTFFSVRKTRWKK